MASDRYARVKSALLAALDQPEPERSSFLQRLEATDPDVAADVRSLLHQEHRALPIIDAGSLVSAGHELERLGPYPIEAQLGRGGSGVVYRARDLELDRRIALKVLPPHIAGRATLLERFRSEARILASISHPNIATIHALHADHDPPFFSLEFVDGGTLADRLQSGPLPLGESLRVAEQIARALEAAHSRGVVHRDLKPANVMLTSDGLVKVVDFGIASRTVEGGEGEDDEDPPVWIPEGTPGYLSPEQIDGPIVDDRSDIWSFGCVLFECLSNTPAFPGDALDRVARTRSADVNWRGLPDNVPERLRDVLRACLQRDPQVRIASMALVREELEEESFRTRLARRRRVPSTVPAQTPNNLPQHVDGFFGRERLVEEVVSTLNPAVIVSLLGAGGTGKTRLAVEASRLAGTQFRDGVWIVDLAQLPRGDSALGVATEAGRVLDVVADAPDGPLEALVSHLRGKQCLLIFDSCEHLKAAVSEVLRAIRAGSPLFCALATSRESLDLPGEVKILVPPLSVASGTEPISEAEQLFIDRALAADPGLSEGDVPGHVAASICRRLEGNPLAIELAAARVSVLSAEEVAERLADRFSILGSPGATSAVSQAERAANRHRSLDASIDWTHDLLSETEQIVFRRLAVFQGGCSLAAVESVCADVQVPSWEVLPGFLQLVEKSLVYRTSESSGGGARSRYRMPDTIREYARQRLRDAGEESASEERLASYCANLAEEARQQIHGGEQTRWIQRLDEEHANFRHVLSRSLRGGGLALPGMRLAASLGDYWQIRGLHREAAAAYAEALVKPECQDDDRLRVRLLTWAGNTDLALGRHDESRAHFELSVSISERTGDLRGLGGSVNGLGILAWRRGDLEEARACYERATGTWARLGEDRLVGVSENNLGVLDMETGNFRGAKEHYQKSLRIQEQVGDRHATAVLRANIGLAAMQLGEYEVAREAFERSLELRRELGDQAGVAHSLNGLGSVMERQGNPEAARPRFEEALTIYDDIGDESSAVIPLINLGFVALHAADVGRARASFERARLLAEDAGDPANVARARTGEGMLAMLADNLEAARDHFERALSDLVQVGDRWGVTLVGEQLVQLLVEEGNDRMAARFAGFLDAERSALCAPRTVLQDADRERSMARLSARLSRSSLEAEQQAGAAMGLKALIEECWPRREDGPS